MVESNYPHFLNVIDEMKDSANPLADYVPASFVNEVEVVKNESDEHDSSVSDDEIVQVPSPSHFIDSEEEINDGKKHKTVTLPVRTIDNNTNASVTNRRNESDSDKQSVQQTLRKHKSSTILGTKLYANCVISNPQPVQREFIRERVGGINRFK